MKLKHPNIVRLLGYCYEMQNVRTLHEGKFIFVWSTESLLCLECLPMGSLDRYISGMTFKYEQFLLIYFHGLIIVPKKHVLMNLK
jgi:hypothetical protein